MIGFKNGIYLRYQCSKHWPRPGIESCPTSNRSISCKKVDTQIWDWICQLLTDDTALEDGLNQMIENAVDTTGIRRKRLDTLVNVIAKRELRHQRLVEELADGAYEDDFTKNIFQQTINENTDMIRELVKERDAIEAELSQVEITTEFQHEINAIAAQIRGKLTNATFDSKRAVMDKLDVKVVFRNDDDTKWLDVSCSLISAPESVELHRS